MKGVPCGSSLSTDIDGQVDGSLNQHQSTATHNGWTPSVFHLCLFTLGCENCMHCGCPPGVMRPSKLGVQTPALELCVFAARRKFSKTRTYSYIHMCAIDPLRRHHPPVVAVAHGHNCRFVRDTRAGRLHKQLGFVRHLAGPCLINGCEVDRVGDVPGPSRGRHEKDQQGIPSQACACMRACPHAAHKTHRRHCFAEWTPGLT